MRYLVLCFWMVSYCVFSQDVNTDSLDVKPEPKVLANFSVSGTEIPKKLSFVADQPGIVWVNWADQFSSRNSKVEFTPYLSAKFTDIARIDFPGEVQFEIKGRYSNTINGTASGTIMFAEYVDVLEPNDLPEQAIPISLQSWYQHMLYPNTDSDHFAISLQTGMYINVKFQKYEPNVKTELLDEKGQFITNVFPHYVSKGNYIIKNSLKYSNSNTEPIFFKITALPEFDELEPNDTISVPIEIGETYRVSLKNPNDVDSLKFKSKKDGVVYFRTAYAYQDQASFSINTIKGNPFVVSVKKGEELKLKLSAGRYWKDTPFAFKTDFKDVLDINESNDSITQATILKGDGTYFSIYPFGDEDWYQINTTGEAKVILSIFDALDQRKGLANHRIGIELFDENKVSKGKFAARNSEIGQLFSSPVIDSAGTWYVKIHDDWQHKHEQLLGMRMFGTNVERLSDKNQNSNIYFVGYELDSSANLSIKSLAKSVEANYAAVDSTGSLGNTFKEVLADAKKQRSSWWWLLLLAVAIGVVYWWVKKKKGMNS